MEILLKHLINFKLIDPMNFVENYEPHLTVDKVDYEVEVIVYEHGKS